MSEIQNIRELKRTLHLDPNAADFGIVLQSASLRKIYCTNCGKAVNDDEKFCYFCGKPLKDASAVTVVPKYNANTSGSVVEETLKGIPDDIGHGQERAKILDHFFPMLHMPASKNHEFNVLPNLSEVLTQKAISKFSFQHQTLIRRQMQVECLLGVYYSGVGSLFPLHTVMIFTDRSMYACSNGYEFYSGFYLSYEDIRWVEMKDESILIHQRNTSGNCKLSFSKKFMNGVALQTMLSEMAR